MYGKAFFDLQLEFARTVAALSGLPLPRALLEYTNFYIRFGLGRDFDESHPAWQTYAAGLRDSHDPSEWTFRFYSRRPDGMAAPAVVATFGCFAYSRSSDDRIRLHFQNVERPGQSPLAQDRREHRRAELVALFTHVKQSMPAPPRVAGASWLYNIDAYRRLFPEPYLAAARVLERRFRHMPLWGQFVDRHGKVRDGVAGEFRRRLERVASLDDLDRCFPFQVLAPEGSALDCFEFYGV
jgi:hypothetical protein